MKHPRVRKAMIWLLLLSGGYTGICFGLAYMYRHPSRSDEPIPPGFREIEVANAPVWVIGPDKPKASFVMCHGYGGSRNTWTEVATELAARGYRCYIPSMPAHGKNPDESVGFGVTESQLALEVSKEARTTSPTVIGLGVSLGGSSILLACQRDAGAFDGICTESAFPELSEATDTFLKRALPAGNIIFAPVKWIGEWQSGVRSSKVSPILGAAAMKGKPVLIMHGTKDQLFPIEFGERIAAAAGATLWRVEGASHAYCYEAAPDEYVERLARLAVTPAQKP